MLHSANAEVQMQGLECTSQSGAFSPDRSESLRFSLSDAICTQCNANARSTAIICILLVINILSHF